MSDILEKFFSGVKYAVGGVGVFYRERGAWKYAALPLGIMLIVYAAAFWAVLHLLGKFSAAVEEGLSGLPAWLSWIASGIAGLSYFIGVVLFLFVFGTTICGLYELFGGLFFDSMIAYHEHERFGVEPRKLTLVGNILYGLDTMFFGVRMFVWFVVLFTASLFFPVVGQVLLVLVMGYHIGVSYLIASANNNGLTVAGLRSAAKRNFALVLGFGVAAYLLLMIPFATIIFLPGFVLGGSELFNREIKEKV